MEIFFYIYLFLISLQDIKTMYIPKIYLIPTIPFLLYYYPYSLKNIICSLLFGFVSFYFHKRRKWMGSMDVYFLFFFGLILGLERMIICMYISIGIGILWILISKRKICPFLFCLSIGFIVSMHKGYTMYYWMIQKIIG